MTPEALRRRMAHGNIYKPDRIDAALGNYFRVGNLGALRELALLWVADRVDDALEEYRERHGITETWELRERVIVAVTGAPGTEHLIRRAARIAQRSHGELIGVHVTADSGLSTTVGELVAAQRRLLEVLGGEFREVVASDIAVALIDVARAENATQIVLGASRRGRLQRLTQGSVISRVISRAGPIDDRTITADVAEALRNARDVSPANAQVEIVDGATTVRGTGIRVQARDGVVTLQGVVEEAKTVARAEAVAQGVRGVRSVDNKLISSAVFEHD
jgi:two-component system sensor histidine kinase KdpD